MKISLTARPTGANVYYPRSAIVYRVDVNPEVGGPSDRVEPGFFSALFEQLPALQKRIAELPKNWLEDRASLAHLFMLAAVELQSSLGCEIEPGEVQPTPSAGVYNVVLGYENQSIGAAAGSLAAALIQHLLPEGESSKEDARRTFDYASARQRFVHQFQGRVMSLEHRYVFDAARARGIPAEYLGNGLVVYGQGRYQQRRLKHFSQQTSHISFVLSSNKAMTNRLLAEIGLPVPEQRIVYSNDDASSAADEIGYPVVVKPLDSDFGRGVSVGLNDSESVAAAYDAARRFRRGVLVERMIEGTDHRLLVIDGQFVAAANRIPAHVVGDGASSIEDLVEQANRDPRRGAKGLTWLLKLELDQEADRLIAAAGHTRESVPASGEIVYLRGASNLSAGGTSIDVTDRVHPDNRRMARWVAQALGIDVAGIDYITTDISRSYKEIGGGICEVNTTPAFSPHVAAEGAPRDIAGPVIDAMYSPGQPSRIPIAVITGNNGRAAVTQILGHILAHAGHRVGLATDDGVFIDGEQIGSSYVFGESKVRLLLRNPTIDAAVLDISPSEVLRRGLGFEDFDVAAVLNAPADRAAVNLDDVKRARGWVLTAKGEETPPDDDVDLAGQIAAIEAVTKAARKIAVVNADDELCRGLASRTEVAPIMLVSTATSDGDGDLRIGRGRPSAVLDLSDGGVAITIVSRPDSSSDTQTNIAAGLPMGATHEQAQGVLFAAAVAHCLGKTADEISSALQTFDFGSL